MKNTLFYLCLCIFVLAACQKRIDIPGAGAVTPLKPGSGFVQYIIKKGAQYANLNTYTRVDYSELKFKVRFDSSAIYQSLSPENQGDINKLYGFSDNNALHHEFSARFGWNWSGNSLLLYAYTYNNSIRANKLIGAARIGDEINCSIKITGDKYIFTLNEKVETMPRTSTTPKGTGYKLYPYFGGNELAPHDVNIWIKEL